MNSREKILGEIATGVFVSQENSYDEVKGIQYSDKRKQFIEILTTIGGNVVVADSRKQVESYIKVKRTAEKKVVNIFNGEKAALTKDELYNTDLAVLKGGVAVAENGAIWITEKSMGNRILPFSCEQLIIVIEEQNLVNNMHEAYDQINIAEDGYGVFIAGPSKTADIEQSLVIGAHGPVEFLVFIINE